MSHYKTILAIESSCDETAVAIVENGTKIISSTVASSTSLHAKYGGIVPEVAAREQLDYIIPTLREALAPLSTDKSDVLSTIQNHIDAIAIANGPGLIGSLLVGVETAKTIAFITKIPIIPVNHVLAHMYANFIDTSYVIARSEATKQSIKSTERLPRPRDRARNDIQFPAISLVVSGGHTELYLMTSESDIKWLGGTLDDAAGEAFDKTARLLGFENRGGVAIQESASKSSAQQIGKIAKLPRPMLDKQNMFNFSFSGLKTAISREVTKLKETNNFTDISIQALAYEVQESITDVLVKKTLKAAEAYNATSILVSGGVSANLRLREKFSTKINDLKSIILFHAPPISLCTDNAVYIGSYAYFRGKPVDWHEIIAIPDLTVEVGLDLLLSDKRI